MFIILHIKINILVIHPFYPEQKNPGSLKCQNNKSVTITYKTKLNQLILKNQNY